MLRFVGALERFLNEGVQLILRAFFRLRPFANVKLTHQLLREGEKSVADDVLHLLCDAVEFSACSIRFILEHLEVRHLGLQDGIEGRVAVLQIEFLLFLQDPHDVLEDVA